MPPLFEKLRKSLKSATAYGQASSVLDRDDQPAKQAGPKGLGPSSSGADQDKMREDLEDARNKEYAKRNLSSYKPPRTVKVR